MTGLIAAKKATACVSDRVYVSHPAETAVVYINNNEDGQAYVGWLATVADEDEAQEDCGALELTSGEYFLYLNDINDLAVELQRRAYRLGFSFAQVIELIEDPTKCCITEL